MAEDKAFRDALNDFLTRLHTGANSGNPRIVDAWRQMGYDIPDTPYTSSVTQAQLEVIKQETTPQTIETETAEVKPEEAADNVRKSLIVANQPQPVQWWNGESDAKLDSATLAKSYEYLVRSTQAQSTNKKS